MDPIPDSESQAKKRHIEEALDEGSDPSTSETSKASGNVVLDTGSKDGNIATTETADNSSAIGIEGNVEVDHLTKKRRLDILQIADASAEADSTGISSVNAGTQNVEAISMTEKNTAPDKESPEQPLRNYDQEQGVGGPSTGKAPEDNDSSAKVSQPAAEDVTSTKKWLPDDSQMESNADPTPTTLSTSTTDLASPPVRDQEKNSTVSAQPPSKKLRLDSAESASHTNNSTSIPAEAEEPHTDVNTVPKDSPLISLPMELLAEILIETGSSQHVLAVARTCKVLCNLLLSPEAQFIWRGARSGLGCTFEFEEPGLPPQLANFLPGQLPQPHIKTILELPNLPSHFFSEAAYAAFVFDSGHCDCCGKETSVMYSSFGLRARLCRRTSCKEPANLVAIHNSDLNLLSILPSNEMYSFERNGYSPLLIWPHPIPNMVRKDALEAARAEFALRHKDAEYQKKYIILQERKKEWMEFCAHLYKWKAARQKQYYKTKESNEKMGKQLASKNGWDYNLIITHSRCGIYQHHKTQIIEDVTEAEVNTMKDDIEAELLAYSEKAERRKTEVSLMKNRQDVAGLYERLRSGQMHTFLPSLATFRRLPVISMLQSAERDKKSSSAVEAFEKNPVMNDILNNQLKKWTENAKMDFGAILGFPRNWKHASKNILHPVERVTARFVCTRCERVDVKYREDECLDFIGACRHECGVGNQKMGRIRKGGKKAIWDSKIFARDDKAINALKQTLPLFDYAEDKDGGHCLTKAGMAVMCTSCDPPMVLDTRTIVGHSHRHDDMQPTLPLLEDVSTYLSGYPYEHGVVAKLLGPTGLSPAAKAEILSPNFGCRHCLRIAQVAEAASAATQGPNTSQSTASAGPSKSAAKTAIELSSVIHRMHETGIQGPLTKPPPLFSFNGIRSHLKAKHGIEDIRDEDIFCRREVDFKLDETVPPPKMAPKVQKQPKKSATRSEAAIVA